MHVFHSAILLTVLLSLTGCPDKPVTGQSSAPGEQLSTDSNSQVQPPSDTIKSSTVEEVPAERSNEAGEEINSNSEESIQEPVNRDRPRPVHPSVIVSDPPRTAGKRTDMNIITAEVNKNLLDITFSYGGGCKPHLFELFSTGKEENGVITVILADHVTDDLCKMLITEKITFDIRSIRPKTEKEVSIRVNSHNPVQWNL